MFWLLSPLRVVSALFSCISRPASTIGDGRVNSRHRLPHGAHIAEATIWTISGVESRAVAIKPAVRTSAFLSRTASVVTTAAAGHLGTASTAVISRQRKSGRRVSALRPRLARKRSIQGRTFRALLSRATAALRRIRDKSQFPLGIKSRIAPDLDNPARSCYVVGK